MMRPWYSKYTIIRGTHIFWALTLIVMGAAIGSIQLLFGDNSDKQFSVSDTVAATFVVVFIVGTVALACSTTLSKYVLKMRQWLFPAGVFLIGHQCYIDKETDKWRRPILIAFFVTIPLALAGLIYEVL